MAYCYFLEVSSIRFYDNKSMGRLLPRRTKMKNREESMSYEPHKTSATRTIDDNLDYVDWQLVYTISDPVNRQIIFDALEGANVRTILKSHDNDAYGGILDHRFAPGCGQILVARQEIELASEIIAELLGSLSSTNSYLDE